MRGAQKVAPWTAIVGKRSPVGKRNPFRFLSASAKGGSVDRYSGEAESFPLQQRKRLRGRLKSGEAESFPLPKRNAKGGSVDRYSG